MFGKDFDITVKVAMVQVSLDYELINLLDNMGMVDL